MLTPTSLCPVQMVLTSVFLPITQIPALQMIKPEGHTLFRMCAIYVSLLHCEAISLLYAKVPEFINLLLNINVKIDARLQINTDAELLLSPSLLSSLLLSSSFSPASYQLAPRPNTMAMFVTL